MALLFGFKEHEIAGANPKFGWNQAAFYTKFPIDIRTRLEDLKKVHSYEVKNVVGNLIDVNLRLKGLEKINLETKKKVTITMVNTFNELMKKRRQIGLHNLE
ncbi:Uncharacterized protein FKW44_003463, partial [Caligus rogercresseyi]